MSLVSHAELANFYNLNKKYKFLILFCPLSSPVSKAKILGNHELIVKSGSDINLTCVASQISNPPSFIYWYKGGRGKKPNRKLFSMDHIYIYPIHSIYSSVINYSQRGGISVQTDRNTKTSKLLIAKATYGKILVDISKNGRNPNKVAPFSPFCPYSQAIAATTLALRQILVRHIYLQSGS